MTLSISRGSDWRYCAREVGKGTENYYSAAVASGEPPGVWRGAAAERVGLVGKANDLQLEALYGHFVDPRDARFEQRDQWGDAQRLGRAPAVYKSHEQIFAEMCAQEPNPANIEEERAEQLWYEAGTKVRESRAFFDATYSPPKSVSVLYTAFMSESAAAKDRGDEREAAMWAARAEVVEDAVWKASGEMIRRMEREAGYSRAGYHGGRLKSGETTGRWVDGNGFIVASFLQHTSRPVDGRESPQLHVHNLILNRIECEDGKWRTLDGRALYQERAASGALADRVVQAELQRRLGVEFGYDPHSKSFEVKGIDRSVRDLFSARRQAIASALPEYVEAFRRRTGREPNALELSALAQQATLKTRQAKLKKDDATTLEEKVEEWTARAREAVGADLHDIAHNTIDRRDPAAERTFDPDKVIAQAIASVQETKATWTRSDLIMHLHRQLPAELASLDPDYQDRILSQLADRAISPSPEQIGTPDEVVCLDAPEFIATPDEFKLKNGESVFHRHGSSLYATRRVLTAEARIEDAVRDRETFTRVTPEVALQAVEDVNQQLRTNDPSGTARLSDDQAAVLAGVLSSGAKVELVVGPAGTGKSFVMSTVADKWEYHTGGRVFGLATAQNAANVLADEGLANTDNIDSWLATQAAIDSGRASSTNRVKWRLRRGDLVIVDEASMVDTVDLAEVQRRADEAGAKLLLVGDHAQLGAVGAGGAFRLAQESGRVYELEEVRRFRAEWERDASLGLRDGDADAVREYDAHGRLVECQDLNEAHQRAADLYVADTLAGRKSFLIAATNEDANDLAMRVRDQLVQHGLVEEQGVSIGQGNTRAVAGVGDLVQARKNNKRIRNSRGESLVNRGRYMVIETHDSGDLTVQALADDGTAGEPIEIPANYARRHLSLGYAVTQHGVQGSTGHSGYGIITPSTSASAAYVALTRGTHQNLAFVVDQSDAKDLDLARAATGEDTPRRSAAAILAEVIEGDGLDKSATQVLRDNLEDAGSMRVIGHRYYESRRYLAEHRYLDMVSDLLPGAAAERFSEDPARATLYRLLEAVEAAGVDPQEALADAVSKRELGTAESIAQVLHWRITNELDVDLENVQTTTSGADREATDTYAARVPDGDSPVHQYAKEWADLADQRVQQLGEICAERPPKWAVEHLGSVPEDPIERAEWTHKAGTVAAYREAYNLDEDPAIIGRAPAAHHPERREEWHAAWRALGRPEPLADERQATDAELRNAIEHYEAEKEWAPPAVASEMRDANLAAVEARAAADRLSAEVQQLDAADERRAELEHRLSEADEQAAELEERRDRLERIHQVRGQWYLVTAEARDAAVAARRELDRREADNELAQREQPERDETHQKAAVDERRAELEHQPTEPATATLEEPERAQVQDEELSPVQAAFPPDVDKQQNRTAEADTEHAQAQKEKLSPAQAAFPPDVDKQQEPAATTGAEPKRAQAQDEELSPAVRSLQAAFPPAADKQLDLDDAEATAEAAAKRMSANDKLRARIEEAKEAKKNRGRDRDEEARRRQADEAARQAAERGRDQGISR